MFESQPVLISFAIAAAGSALCIVCAWMNWKQYSQTPIAVASGPRATR